MPFVDLDERIERRAGRSIPEIFEAEGEAAFRALEREALAEVCAEGGAVVATGGGVPVDEENRRLMRESGVVVLLEARARTIRARQAAEGGNEESARPMLAAMTRCYRSPAQGRAPGRLRRGRRLDGSHRRAGRRRRGNRDRPRLRDCRGGARATAGRPTITGVAPSYTVTTKAGTYHGYVGSGLLEKLGALMRNAGLDGTAFVIADGAVFDLYGEPVMASLKDAGFEAYEGIADPGESSKSLELAGDIYGWLAGRRAERRDCVVALGGGVAGDLGGFIAATYLRGMPFVQVPTTLLAMVDASIGGRSPSTCPRGRTSSAPSTSPASSLPTWRPADPPPPGNDGGLGRGRQAWTDPRPFPARRHRPRSGPSARPRPRRPRRRHHAQRGDQGPRRDGGRARKRRGMRNLLNYGHTVGHALEAVLD